MSAEPSPAVKSWAEAPEFTSEPVPTQRHPTTQSLDAPERLERGVGSLTVLNGVYAGRVMRIESDETVIGRAHDANLQLDDPSVSRCHARVMRVGDSQYSIEDLDSTNGTWLGGERVTHASLSAGDRIQLGPKLSLRFEVLSEEEDGLQRRLYETSTRDALTGLLNRAALMVRLRAAIRESQLSYRPLSLLLLDLDFFKSVNDTLGHAAGDDLLREVAKRLVEVVRTTDAVARYGGEEFVVLARATPLSHACELAERIRRAVGHTRVEGGEGVASTTVSIGVAALSECDEPDAEGFLRVADSRMYKAKRNGRNRTWGR